MREMLSIVAMVKKYNFLYSNQAIDTRTCFFIHIIQCILMSISLYLLVGVKFRSIFSVLNI